MTCPGCQQAAQRCTCTRLGGLGVQAPEPNVRERVRANLFGAIELELHQLVGGRLVAPVLDVVVREAQAMLVAEAPESAALTPLAAVLVADQATTTFTVPGRDAYRRILAVIAIELLSAELAPALPGGWKPELDALTFDLEGVRAATALIRADLVERRAAWFRGATPGRRSS